MPPDRAAQPTELIITSEDNVNDARRAQILLLSTADFDNPIWTNKQHIAQGLSAFADVTYIDSLGLRRPTFNRSDIGRILRRLLRQPSSKFGPTPSRPENLKVLALAVLPFHGVAVIRWVNRLLIAGSIRKHRPLGGWDVLWTFSPLTYGLEGLATRVVYHSVDFLHTFPGVPSNTLRESERVLVRNADVVLASSSMIGEHLASIGGEAVRLWENVAKTELFAAHRCDKRLDRAIFAGNLTPTKIDFELLYETAATGIELAIAGTLNVDGTAVGGALTELLAKPNVTYLGVLTPEELASELGRSKVGLIPYRIGSHTDGIFPMKVYEYLAAGLTVVSTALPSLTSSDVASRIAIIGPRAFAATTKKSLDAFSDLGAQQRTEFASSRSWANRQAQAKELILELLDLRKDPS